MVDNLPKSASSTSKMPITWGQTCPLHHSVWYLLLSNLHPCSQSSDVGWNCMLEYLHRLATNMILFIFFTNTLEQGGQKLPSNFFIFKIISFSLPFLLNCLHFSRNIYSCSLTSFLNRISSFHITSIGNSPLFQGCCCSTKSQYSFQWLSP